jgi:formylglycine-generating enzyme required for sulfatase activity
MRFFLSHAGEDRAQARALAEGLIHTGMEIWCDALPGAIPPGTRWVRALEAGLEASTAYLLLVGRSTVDGWVEVELDYAINRQARQPDFLVVPVLLPGVGVDELPPLVGRFQAIGLEELPAALGAAGFSRLRQELESQAGAEPPSLDPEVCPFPGLEAFDEGLARFFFGRDRETRDLLELLGPTPSGYRRWLQIEGASGSGKSSLARAGLLPAIRRGWLDGRRKEWRIAVLRPGHKPVRNLARALRRGLGRNGGPEIEELDTQLRSGDEGLTDLLEELLEPDESCLLLIDQLEEVFTLTDAAPDLPVLDGLLATSIASGDSRLHLVTTIRNDLVPALARLPRMEGLLNTHASRYLLTQMKEDALIESIREPVHLARLVWETRELPARIVRDTLEAPGGLPLLGYTLWALWDKREGNTLLEEVYSALGGVGGALAGEADRLLAQLATRSEKGRRDSDRAWNLLLELVQTNERAGETRRIITRPEALAAAGSGAAGERVLLRLSGQRDPDAPANSPAPPRLVVVAGESRVELAHEALLRRWGSLREKIWEQADRLECRKRLDAAVKAWLAAGRPRGDLPGARKLEYYRRAETINAEAQEFLRRGRRRVLARRMMLGALIVALTLGAFQWMDRRARAERRKRAYLEVAYQVTALDSLRKAADGLIPGAPDASGRMREWLADAEGWKTSFAALASDISTSRAYASGKETFAGEAEQVLSNIHRIENGRRDLFSPGGLFATVQARLQLAEAADARSADVSAGSRDARWQEVDRTIRAMECPKYQGRSVPHRKDVYPLRINPQGLWEMIQLRSGTAPAVDPATGNFRMDADSGLVFVLLPAGRFWMGAQKENPDGPNYDPRAVSDRESPPREVDVEPFYISKYEMTRAQWYRLTGRTVWRQDARPVGLVSWNEMTATLPAFGMLLPTEKQWEYATRAGTRSPFWSGDSDSGDCDDDSGDFDDDLGKAGWYDKSVEQWPTTVERPLPVGLLAPNDFGLYDVHGNSWELCSTLFEHRDAPAFVHPRALRGGSYQTSAKQARASARSWYHPSSPAGNVGLRPVLPLNEQSAPHLRTGAEPPRAAAPSGDGIGGTPSG